MKERNLAILLIIILIILGVIGSVISISTLDPIKNGTSFSSYNKFNFYKSELDINGTFVKEKLFFNTNKEYHTLFRTFESVIISKNNPNVKNSLILSSVECQKGSPYFRINNYCYKSPDFTKASSCEMYTENNEYGCTFGDYYGFSSGTDYYISSSFEISPENLFKINGNYYIKFIAYGRNNHVLLNTNDNLIINGNAIYTDTYSSKDYTIIYIPYTGDISKYKIIEKSGFEYDSKTNEKENPLLKTLIYLGILLLHLIPAALFFIAWYFFGKEINEDDVPEELSQIPNNNRKPCEVAAFFNPPFGRIDKNFFSTMLFDFYRRKIIDIKLSEKLFGEDLMIKINDKQISDLNYLDNIENKFMNILSRMKDYCPEKYIQGEYFNLNKSSKSLTAQTNLSSEFMNLQSAISKESIKYLEKTGVAFFAISMIVTFFISIYTSMAGLAIVSIISLIIVSIIGARSSLLLKYKNDFYNEYQKWKSFKKWLNGSPAMKETGHKGVILWEEYLVYATALGVSKKVLKELKNQGMIKEKDYNFYSGVNIASASFVVSSLSSSGGGGGGFSGGGGGGVGGGGGGGR